MATKNIFEVLSDHEEEEEGSSNSKGLRLRGNKAPKKQEKNTTNISEGTGKEKVDHSHHRQPVRDDRHTKNGPSGITKNVFKKHGGGSMNIGTVESELRGADSYAPKEIAATNPGKTEEEPADQDAPKTQTLKEYYAEKGIRYAPDEQEDSGTVPVATKIDTEALKKEKLFLISRKEENPDDRTKAKKKGGDTAGYKAGFSSTNSELLGFKTTKKYVENKPRREDRPEEKKYVDEKPATEQVTEAPKPEGDVPTTEGDAPKEGEGRRGNRGDVRGGDHKGGEHRGGEHRGGEHRGGEHRGGDRRGGEHRGERRGGEGRGGEGRGGEGRGGEGRGGEGKDPRGGERKFDNRRGAPRGDNHIRTGGGRKTGGKEFKADDQDFPDLQ